MRQSKLAHHLYAQDFEDKQLLKFRIYELAIALLLHASLKYVISVIAFHMCFVRCLS